MAIIMAKKQDNNSNSNIANSNKHDINSNGRKTVLAINAGNNNNTENNCNSSNHNKNIPRLY